MYPPVYPNRAAGVLVTVIIPTYNRARFIARAVRSLVRQSDDVLLDIIIIDDGSTDNTPEVLSEITATYDCVRRLWQENQGVAAARNLGLLNLRPDTQIVTFLDSDDVSPEGRFAGDLPILAADPKLDLTYGRVLRVSGVDDTTLEPAGTALQADIVTVQLSSGLYRRRLLEKTGLFDLEMEQGEDTDYLLRMFEENAVFTQTDTMTLYYIRHEGNMTNDIKQSERYFARALLKSVRRRKADPSRVLRTPSFDSDALKRTGFF